MSIAAGERERLAAWAREEMADVPWNDNAGTCYACGQRGRLIPDRGRRYCERCLFTDMDREAAEIAADTPVTVRAR